MESNNIKILVIDDNKDNHITFSALIKDAFAGAVVLNALNGKRGIELALLENPDVILLDIVMPDMDGFEVCGILKEDPRLCDIPLIFITALKGEKQTRIRALEAGAEAFLTKPIDEVELTAQIRAMIKIKNANSDKRNENEHLASLVEEQVKEIRDTQIATLNMLEDVTRENEARKRSEEALFKSEEKYRTIFNNVQDVFYQTNLDGTIIEISPSIRHFSKYTREELIGKSVSSLYYDLDDRKTLIDTILSNGILKDYELQFMSGTDEPKYVSINASLIHDAGGIPIHIDGAIRDIHDRKLAENRIKLTTKILNTINSTSFLKDTLQQTINLIQQEIDCEAIAVRLKSGNDYPYFIYNGFNEAFIQAENFLVKVDDRGYCCLDNSGAACYVCTCGLVLSGKTNAENPLFTIGGSFWTNDSPQLLNLTEKDDPRINPRNRCIYDGYLSFALIPIRAKGEMVGLLQLNGRKKDCFTVEMIKNLESICEIIGVALMRKQAEEALEKSHRLLVNLSEQVPGVVYQYRLYPDGHSCFPYASSGMNDIYEVTPEEVSVDATAVFERIHPDDLANVSELIFESARTLNHFQSEYRVVLPRQGLRWRHCDAVPERTDDNSTLWHGFIYDITERKQAEKELLALNEELDQRVKQRTTELEAAILELETFSYSVSHDLKAPLRHISGFIGLFLENSTKEYTEEELGYLKKVTEASTEMAQLIDALLSFSRLNMTDLRKTKIDTTAMVHQVIRFFEPEVENRKITFQIGSLHEINGDEGLIKQVWTNLISNAIKYTGKKDEAIIEIGSTQSNQLVTFFVRDNGAGFNMKYSEKLFGVFQRLHKTREFEGVGIGLANVNRIVKRHGGHCRAEGAQDQGATFYFSIPN